MQKRAVLIANPAASQFTGGLHRTIVRLLASEFDVEPVWPQSGAHARQLAADAATTGVDLVVAIGGDGVVHQVAQAIAGSGTVLGIVPAGTTNVLAKLVGIPDDPSDAARQLAAGFEPTTFPTLELSVTVDDTDHRVVALFALGAGPDAAVVAEAETEPYRKYRFGSVHYARTAIGVVRRDIRHRKPTATLSVDGAPRLPVMGMMAQFHRAYTFFGKSAMTLGTAAPAPMTVLAIRRLPLRRALAVLRGAVGSKRTLDDVKDLTVLEQVSAFVLDAPDGIEVQADGELLGMATRVAGTFRPDSLTVAVPVQKPPGWLRRLIRRPLDRESDGGTGSRSLPHPDGS